MIPRERAILVLAVCLVAGGSSPAATGGFSLRFHGAGVNDIDRVKIRIDNPETPADVGATDFTIEFWMKANPGQNTAGAIAPGGSNWIYGNIVLDRDVYGGGDYGDHGVSLGAGRLAFGVGTTASAHTIVGTRNVTDGQWHHVAVTRRRSDGRLQIYVDGALDAGAIGPTGDASYRNNRATAWPGSDPYLVIGAEKHDAGPLYPSYRGWIDELRISRVLRYDTGFARPAAPFVSDASTAALYHFDEGTGDVIGDAAGASPGVRRFGGSPAGPEWSADTPWGSVLSAPRNLRVVR